MEKNSNKQNQVPETLRYWDSWRHVAPGRLKRISGGNLNGKTDINPIWRFEALTSNFGPIGFGWNYREVERWTNEGAGEIGAFVKVELRIKIDGEWSEPIEGVGGSRLCARTNNGPVFNDEAWKMATTDAISVACKSLGMAADVYTGLQSHDDPDQKKDGPDYGTKYEDRRGAPSGNTRQGPRVENRPTSAPSTGQYQAPPPSGQDYVQPQGPRQHTSRVCEVVDIQKGKADRLIKTLSTYDPDDRDLWAKGLAWLRNEVVLREGAEELIVQKALEMREAYYQQQVDNNRIS